MADGFDTIPCEPNKSDCQEISQYTFDTQIGSAYNVSRAIAEQWQVIDKLKQDVGDVAYKTAVKDYNGNIFENLTLKGENGVNVDINEDDPEQLTISLDQDITDQIEINMENIILLENNTDSLDTRVTQTETSITELTPDVVRALKTPLVTPTETKLVAVDTTNSQEMLELSDDDFYIDNKTIRLVDNLLLRIYPVGSIYININNVNPETFLGGQWEQLPAKYALWTTNETITNEGEADAWNGVGVRRLKNALPNITGSFKNAVSDQTAISGVFHNKYAGSAGFQGSQAIPWYSVDFNAYYGDNSTYPVYRDEVDYVQPPAYKVHVWKRIS